MGSKLSDEKIQTWIDNRFGIPNTVNTQAYKDFADYYYKEMLEQFRAAVDKLTVIHADGCTTNLGIIGATCNCGVEAQLQYDKQTLLDLMMEEK